MNNDFVDDVHFYLIIVLFANYTNSCKCHNLNAHMKLQNRLHNVTVMCKLPFMVSNYRIVFLNTK